MTPTLLASSLLQSLAFPPGILLVGLVLGIAARMLGRPRLAFALLALPVIATVALSLPWVANQIIEPLEQRALADSRAALAARPLPRTAVVLGGAVGMPGRDLCLDDSGYDLDRGADRVVAGVRLWRDGQVDRLVFSGGSGAATSEGELMARFAADLGLPRSAMMFETDSRTTRENARDVARLLRQNGLGPDIALVTSAMHLPRAMAEFRCAGLAPVGVPAEFEVAGTGNFPDDWIPSSGTLDRSRRALKEWVGARAGGC